MIFSAYKTYLFFLIILLSISLFGCSTDSDTSVNLSINIDPVTGGIVNHESGTFQRGERITLRAEPADGYQFVRWEGQISGEENPITILMNGNRRITAVFRENPFQDGDGSVENPYTVSSFDGLMEIRKEENLDKHFIQIGNIDASGSKQIGGFIPIGNREHPFSGSYDGNGYQIADLAYNQTEKFLGLFGYIKEAEIKHVTLTGSVNEDEIEKVVTKFVSHNNKQRYPLTVDLNSDNFKVWGALVGFNEGGVIHNCKSNSSIGSRRYNTGGLVGYNGGEIYNSFVTMSVTGHVLSGGLVAYNSGLIEKSYAIGNVSSLGRAGGLVGYNYGGNIINSYSQGDVSSQGTNGGLTAINAGLIQASYAKGKTIASLFGFTGGLVGENEGEIIDSYSLGAVTYQETSGAGSLVGVNRTGDKIANSFAVGEVVGFPEEVDALKGGIAALNQGKLTAAYWDTETTGQNEGVGEGSPEGTTGLTTAQMTGPAAEANMPEFDWVNVWRTTEGGYPVLRWEED